MKLTISLSPTEEANIHGWVNKGLADPAFAAMPTRIVLEERNRARFDEIAKQFDAPVPPVDPSDPFADLRFRKTISNWAAFGNDFFTPEESNRLKTYPHLVQPVSQSNNYYKQNANFAGERRGNTFWFSDGTQWQPDVNGAADAQVLKFANGVAPPSINIP